MDALDMSNSQWRWRSALSTALACSLIAGCAGLDFQDPLGILPSRSGPPVSLSAQHRQKFQLERSPAAFDWLLFHLVENGMSVAEVSTALGESGERYANDREMKTNGGHYQDTDEGFKWGPDTNGRNVILFFREGKLVNFDPEDFSH